MQHKNRSGQSTGGSQSWPIKHLESHKSDATNGRLRNPLPSFQYRQKVRMDSEEGRFAVESNKKIFIIFKDLLTGVAKYEELLNLSGRLLHGFQQGLESIRRPPLYKTSETVAKILKSHDTRRLKSYIEAGCINNNDSIGNISKSNTILNELKCLVEDATAAIQYSENNIAVSDEACDSTLDMHVQNPKASDYGALIGIIYSMVRQDYEMQEKIISSLSLRSSSEELDSYCLMWSLRPFINDDIMNQAWTIVS